MGFSPFGRSHFRFALEEPGEKIFRTISGLGGDCPKLHQRIGKEPLNVVTNVRPPDSIRQFLRTNNMMENLNKQIKSRTRLVPAFPNINSLMRLVSAICIEISDDWETGNFKYMCSVKEL